MQDKAGIKDALEQRFNWHTFTSEPLMDRKAFDTACQWYDEWLANETRNQLSRVCYSNSSQRSRNDVSISPIAEGVELSVDASLQHRTHSTSMIHPILPRQLLCCQQLSRAMRVFVAWKDSAQENVF
jgi:hypothetical protein